MFFLSLRQYSILIFKIYFTTEALNYSLTSLKSPETIHKYLQIHTLNKGRFRCCFCRCWNLTVTKKIEGDKRLINFNKGTEMPTVQEVCDGWEGSADMRTSKIVAEPLNIGPSQLKIVEPPELSHIIRGGSRLSCSVVDPHQHDVDPQHFFSGLPIKQSKENMIAVHFITVKVMYEIPDL